MPAARQALARVGGGNAVWRGVRQLGHAPCRASHCTRHCKWVGSPAARVLDRCLRAYCCWVDWVHAYEAVRHGFVVGRGFAGPGRRRGALDAFVVGVRTTQIDVVDCVARSREDTFTRDAGRGTDCLDAIWRERVFHRRLTIRAGTMVRRALYEALLRGLAQNSTGTGQGYQAQL